jgi:hypothetical protein
VGSFSFFNLLRRLNTLRSQLAGKRRTNEGYAAKISTNTREFRSHRATFCTARLAPIFHPTPHSSAAFEVVLETKRRLNHSLTYQFNFKFMKNQSINALAAVDASLCNLKLVLDDFSKTNVRGSNYFEQTCKAALVKAYELSLLTTKKNNKNAYFLLSALRGVCEDYIALRFIFEKFGSDSNKVIQLRLDEESYKSSISQWEFFKKIIPTSNCIIKTISRVSLTHVKLSYVCS